MPRTCDLSPGHAQLVQQLEFTPQLGPVDFTVYQLAVSGNGLADEGGRFVEELDPEIADAQFDHPRNIIGAGLGASVEDSVAAAGVGLDGMLRADAVAQFQIVAGPGPAAVGISGAAGEGGAKEAVPHGKH